MSTNDALAPVIARYAHAVQSAGDGQYCVRSATFWLSLGRDRDSDADVAVVRELFEAHGIALSTSAGELGHEPPDAWMLLTTISTRPHRVASIDDLPDALFGAALDPADERPDSIVTDHRLTEPSPAAMSSTVASSPAAELIQPAMPTSASAAAPTVSTRSGGSSETHASVTCPSCGATVPLSALFCPLCDLPRTYIREQLRQRAASTGETYMSLLDRVRVAGWPLPEAQRHQPNVPPGALVVIGIVVLGVGARIGDLVMPLLVLGALVVLGVSVWKPDILDAVIGHRTSGHRQNMTALPPWQLAVIVVVIAAIVLLSTGPAMFGVGGVNLGP